MKKKFDIQRNSLLCVKSIMTIALTVMLCVMVYRQPETYSETFRNCIIMVVTFYFAHQTSKEGGAQDEGSNANNRTPLQARKNVSSGEEHLDGELQGLEGKGEDEEEGGQEK